MNRRLLISLATLAALASPVAALADNYPERPIRMVVPFAVGGLNDILARVIAPRMAEELGQSVVVENKGGAGSNLGTDYVARARPDGYTLLLTGASVAINPRLYAKLSYDVQKDLQPIIQISNTQMVVIASGKLDGVNSVKDLIEHAKKHPGHLNFPSSGTGSPSHLASELFVRTFGIDAVHVPYKGAGLALTALAAGEVQFGVDVLPTALPMHKSGQVKILAVVGDSRFPSLPDVPTLAEAGYPNYRAGSWNVIMAPAGTPPAALGKLEAALQKIMTTDAMRDRLIELAVEPRAVVGSELNDFILSETDKWGKVISDAGIRAD